MARGKATGRYSPRRPGDEDGGGEAWLTTYADAITLLMAFFVMLYAMSQVDAEKFALFVSGLEVPFGNPSASSLAVGGEGLLDQEAVAPPPEVRDAAAHDPLADIAAELQASLEAAGLADIVDIAREDRGLVVNIMTDDLLFATGSTVIGEAGHGLLATVGGIVARLPNDVLVEGHTDDVPLRAGDYTNWNLSTDRAVAVVDFLTAEVGLVPARMGAVGYGEHRPREANDSDANRARNRRVAIVILEAKG